MSQQTSLISQMASLTRGFPAWLQLHLLVNINPGELTLGHDTNSRSDWLPVSGRINQSLFVLYTSRTALENHTEKWGCNADQVAGPKFEGVYVEAQSVWSVVSAGSSGTLLNMSEELRLRQKKPFCQFLAWAMLLLLGTLLNFWRRKATIQGDQI